MHVGPGKYVQFVFQYSLKSAFRKNLVANKNV